MAGLDYADIELALVTFLSAEFPGVRVVTNDIPSDLETSLPVIVVTKLGGPTDRIGLAKSNIDIDIFAADYPSTVTLAGQVETSLRLRRGVTDPVVISAVDVTSSNAPRPYANQDVYRRGCTFSITNR